jgi:hypothetical protein
MWSAILSVPVPPKAGVAPSARGSTWADPLPSHPDEQLHRTAGKLGEASKEKLPISADAEEVALLDTKSARLEIRTGFKWVSR